MKAYLYVAVIVFFLVLGTGRASANVNTNTLRGAVVTAEGTMVSEFTVVARPIVTKPELIRRRRFTNGVFTLEGLDRQKYQFLITAPKFIAVRLDVEFPRNESSTDFRVVILHKLRNEHYLPGNPVFTRSVRMLEQRIPEEAKDHYDRAVELHRDGRLEDALAEYGDAIRFYPTYIQALCDAGTVYLLLNRPDAALTFLKRAAEIDPDNSVIRLNIAAGLLLKKDYENAIRLLNAIGQQAEDRSLPHLFLARAYYFQKRYPIAEQMVRTAVEEDPQLLDGWLLLLNMALERHDFPAARQNLAKLRKAMNNQTFSKFADDQMARIGENNR